MRASAAFRAALLAAAAPVLYLHTATAATTKIWTSDSTADFSAGEARGVAVTVNGALVLSQALERVEGVGEAVIYDAVAGESGSVFVATGEAGRILRVSAGGKVETLATLPEKQVTALAVGPDGALYAGGSPGGKVYRIAGEKPVLFYETKTQYVWSLAFSGPALFVATGLPGEIHRVAGAATGQRVHAASDPHVRALMADRDGTVWAGTSGSGLVLKLDRSGNVTTVFDSAKTEVTAIAGGADGRVWAAVSSSETPGGVDPISAPSPAPAARAPRPAAPGAEGDPNREKPEVTVSVGAPRTAPARPPARTGFSAEVVLFESGEPPRAVWTSSEEMVFDLNGDGESSGVLAATGPKGRLYRVARDNWSLDRTLDEKQVSVLTGGAIATNGSSAFFRLRDGQRTGEYVSAVKDSGRTSVFGAFRLEGEVPSGAKLEVAFRSGESGAPDTTWSVWSAFATAAESAKVAAPPGRYLQWKLRMSASAKESPIVRRVEAAYRNRNAAPVVEAFLAMGPSEVFARAGGGGSNVFETAPDERGIFTSLEEAKPEGAPRKLLRKGYRTLTWKTTDPDGDPVVQNLEFRPVSSDRWLLLKSEVRETFYSFDTASLPDGEYVFRLTASDREANPEDAKSSSRETSPVAIDNTPPAIRRLEASRGAFRFEAADSGSPVTEAAYSVNAREWVRLEPDDGLSDSRRETFSVKLNPEDRSGFLLIRVGDASRNVATASFTAP